VDRGWVRSEAGQALPGVGDLCAAADYFDCMMGRSVPTGDDLSVVLVFGRLYRVGNWGQVFTFVLLDSQAVERGRLEGPDRYRDSSFTGFCFTVVADPRGALSSPPARRTSAAARSAVARRVTQARLPPAEVPPRVPGSSTQSSATSSASSSSGRR
jgi:hypothetical protein